MRRPPARGAGLTKEPQGRALVDLLVRCHDEHDLWLVWSAPMSTHNAILGYLRSRGLLIRTIVYRSQGYTSIVVPHKDSRLLLVKDESVFGSLPPGAEIWSLRDGKATARLVPR